MYPKRAEFIASYLEITCVYYILLDNRALKNCQDGQGKDVAITTPAQSTLRSRSPSSLDISEWPWLNVAYLYSGGSGQRRILWFGFRLLGNVLAQYLECIAPGYDKLGFEYPSPEHNLEAFPPNYKQIKLPLSVPELSTRSHHRRRHHARTLDSPLSGKTRCRHEHNRH